VRAPFHGLAGAAGALACGIAAAIWCAAAPPRHAASALVAVEADAAIPSSYDEAALRALASSEAVLRKASLAPLAAAAIARAARPGATDAFLALLSAQIHPTDTMSRAAELLAHRIETEPGPSRNSLRIVVRMDDDVAAAAAANAVAQAIVEGHNEAAARVDRRIDQSRREKFVRAERRRDAARDRLAALRATDPSPTATIALTAKAEPDPAARAYADASRAAAAAEARRAEAARIYGPRHPEMIQIETEARRAAAALQAARTKAAAAPAPRRQAIAEGGPDPRIQEISAAQDEADLAETAYEKEAARYAAPNREARLIEPAKLIESGARAPASLTVALSALLGFGLFGAAPALGARTTRNDRHAMPDRPHAALRRGALDAAGGRRVIGALDIAASEDARRVLVCGESPEAINHCLRALGLAALAQGWRPLVIDASHARGATRRTVAFEGEAYAISTLATRAGELSIARPCPASRSHRDDAAIAFDLVIFGVDMPHDRIDVAVWVGVAQPDARGRAILAATSNVVWIATA